MINQHTSDLSKDNCSQGWGFVILLFFIFFENAGGDESPEFTQVFEIDIF